jgi:hypothetical protein
MHIAIEFILPLTFAHLLTAGSSSGSGWLHMFLASSPEAEIVASLVECRVGYLSGG